MSTGLPSDLLVIWSLNLLALPHFPTQFWTFLGHELESGRGCFIRLAWPFVETRSLLWRSGWSFKFDVQIKIRGLPRSPYYWLFLHMSVPESWYVLIWLDPNLWWSGPTIFQAHFNPPRPEHPEPATSGTVGRPKRSRANAFIVDMFLFQGQYGFGLVATNFQWSWPKASQVQSQPAWARAIMSQNWLEDFEGNVWKCASKCNVKNTREKKNTRAIPPLYIYVDNGPFREDIPWYTHGQINGFHS